MIHFWATWFRRASTSSAFSIALRVVVDRGGKTWRKGGGREMPANWIWTPASRSWTFGPSGEAEWRERFTALGCASSAAAQPPQELPAEPR